MRFWRYGMVRKDFRPSVISRSMSYASQYQPPKEFISLRAARMMFVASMTLAFVTSVVTKSMLNNQKYLNDKKYLEFMEKGLKPS